MLKGGEIVGDKVETNLKSSLSEHLPLVILCQINETDPRGNDCPTQPALSVWGGILDFHTKTPGEVSIWVGAVS